MVLQAGSKTPVYGFATPRNVIQVKVGEQVGSARADNNGKWRVALDLKSSSTPIDVEISGAGEKLTYHNVVVGEVWICSGQSNMEWSFHDAKIAGQSVTIGDAHKPLIRLFKVMHSVAIEPRHELLGKWVVCTPTAMNDFSLLGYLFGVNLQERIGGAVGMIESDWGGTPAESWTPKATLDGVPDLHNLIDSKAPVPTGAGKDDETKVKPERAASVLYNGMINPLMPYGFRGVAWYQGESNVGRAGQYRELFPSMIESWRKEAGRTFPFVFVQLANYDAKLDPQVSSAWAALREAQEAALGLPSTGMATAVDLAHPDNIHQIQRVELAKRLAWAALRTAYDRGNLSSGPVFKSMTIAGNEVRIEFDNKLNGLLIRSADGLSGFEVAGEDHVFYPAFARINSGAVVISSPKVANPVAVRYAWADDPKTSLYNSAGLPALPFRTDNWSN